MRTHNIPSCYRKSKRSLLCLLIWRFYQPSLARTTPSRTNFHGPKGVRAISSTVVRFLSSGSILLISKVLLQEYVCDSYKGLLPCTNSVTASLNNIEI